MEQIIEHVAAYLGIDTATVKERNFLKPPVTPVRNSLSLFNSIRHLMCKLHAGCLPFELWAKYLTSYQHKVPLHGNLTLWHFGRFMKAMPQR